MSRRPVPHAPVAAGRSPSSVGALLQDWRRRRRLSQLGLASDAGISQRHLSFLESGRSLPSREMVLRLAEHLDVPPRQRNVLLLVAGYAPIGTERAFDDPSLEAARHAVEAILTGHEPHPALAVDRHWMLVAANRAVHVLLAALPAAMLAPPVNVLRLSLHPDGLASRIVNLRDWRAHVLARLNRQVDSSGDPMLVALLEEIRAYPVPAGAAPPSARGPDPLAGVAVPFRLRVDGDVLSFLTTTTVFGTAVDITLSELAIESFLPADVETATLMRRLVTGSTSVPASA